MVENIPKTTPADRVEPGTPIYAEQACKPAPLEVKIVGSNESPIMSYVALGISFCALALSIFQWWDTREGSRLGLYTTRPSNISGWESFDRILSQRLKITILYCSLYEECFTAENKP